MLWCHSEGTIIPSPSNLALHLLDSMCIDYISVWVLAICNDGTHVYTLQRTNSGWGCTPPEDLGMLVLEMQVMLVVQDYSPVAALFRDNRSCLGYTFGYVQYMPGFDYSNALYMHLKLVQKLKLVQNAATLMLIRYRHLVHILYQVHWLPQGQI